MTHTATCVECSTGWRGPNAHEEGAQHEQKTGHRVWFDEDESRTEADSGPFALVCDPEWVGGICTEGK